MHWYHYKVFRTLASTPARLAVALFPFATHDDPIGCIKFLMICLVMNLLRLDCPTTPWRDRIKAKLT
jgi:hypothetical protein